MTIIHGSWLPHDQSFFIWGEDWTHLTPADLTAGEVIRHPYCLGQPALTECLLRPTSAFSQPLAPLLQDKAGKEKAGRRSGSRKGDLAQWSSAPLQLPSWQPEDLWQPVHSAAAVPELAWIYPWHVEGWRMAAGPTVALLLNLPLGSAPPDTALTLGDDLRFWGHVARWSLDLLARGKFIPTVLSDDQGCRGVWQVVIDSAVDQDRLRYFARTLPPSVLGYGNQPLAAPACRLPTPQPEAFLLTFLHAVVGAQVREVCKTYPLPASAALSRELPLREWFQSLTSAKATLDGNPVATARLQDALTTWTAPLPTLDTEGTDQFRVRFTLIPGAPGTDWQLTYGLQSVIQPDWDVDASLIWQHPVAKFHHQGLTVADPQEKLLAGLGRAGRLYAPIRDSLQSQEPTHCLLNPIQAYEFVKVAAWQLEDNGFGLCLPPGLARSTSGTSQLGLEVEAEMPPRGQRLGLKSLLNFRWQLAIGGTSLSREEFEVLLTQGSPLVEVNGQWIELKPQEVKAAQRFFQQQDSNRALSVEDAIRMSTGDTQVIDKLPVVKFSAAGPLQTLIETLTTGNQTLDTITDPPGFQGNLRPYQARGVSWLAFLEQWGLGACLADDMGLGKTIQLIAFLLYLKQDELLEGPSLLVCPTSVLGNWQREVRRFAPSLTTLMFHGDKRPRGSTFTQAARQSQLVITSYALLHRDLKLLQRVDWQIVALDEAQNIKNPSAKQSKAARQLQAQFRLALTGTPVENRLAELWSIMDFINPGYLGPQNFFQTRFATPIERYGDVASLKTLKALVQPFILRRLKTDKTIIQDLPEKQEMTVFCGLSEEQARLYQHTVDQALAAIDDATGVQRRGQVLALLTKLKQICNHPAQFLKESRLPKPPPDQSDPRSGKLQRFHAMVSELLDEGDRALVFTQFAEMGTLLRQYLTAVFDQDVLFLSGSTSAPQREAMVDRFQHDPGAPRLFILSLKAGGVGLNLTRANHVFHFDRWWNPAVENQATDRAFRIGQTRNVQVHKFVCNGTLEERIHTMLVAKQQLSEQVVGTGENWLTELGTDQLRDLLLLDRSAIIDEDG